MEYLFLIYLSKFRWKIVILVENQTLIKKIEILGKHRNFNKNGFPWKNRILIKIEILTKSHLVSDFGVKIKLWSKIEILVKVEILEKNRNFELWSEIEQMFKSIDQKLKFRSKIKILVEKLIKNFGRNFGGIFSRIFGRKINQKSNFGSKKWSNFGSKKRSNFWSKFWWKNWIFSRKFTYMTI